MLIKVCGIANSEFIYQIDDIPINLIGFIFYPASNRFVASKLSTRQINSVPEHIKKVGVFVNEKKERVLNIAEKYQLDFVQLHGDEDASFVKEISQKVRVIKAFRINETFNFEPLTNFENHCSYFLFDTKDKLYGGTSKKFDWDILHRYTRNIPFILSGGITPNDVESIKQIKHPKFLGIDINSGFELEPGKKNIQQIQLFLNQLI